MPRALTVAAALAVASSALATATPSARAADDAPLGPGVVASSSLNIVRISSGWSVCADGSFGISSPQLTGSWSLTIRGWRGSETIAPPTWTSTAASVQHCETVAVAGTLAGAFVADWGYYGVGSYLFARSIGEADWSPATGPHATTVDATP